MAGLKFRILVDNISETEVFKDILIDDSNTFEHFYNAILDAFEFDNNQMASYYISDIEWNKGEEITLVDMGFNTHKEDTPIEMKNVTLSERISNQNQRFILVYDFMAMWIFLIELIETTDTKVEQPQLIFESGEVSEEMKIAGPPSSQNLQFETDYMGSDIDFEEDNDMDFPEFDDIDNYDI